MTTLLSVLLFGLLLGGVYAIMAYGLGLIYGVMRIVNLAHGAVLMLAAYGAYTLNAAWGLDPLLTLPLVLPAAYLSGVALYAGLLRRVASGPPMASLLLLFGVSLCARNLAYLVWSGDDQSLVLPYALETIPLGVPVPVSKLIVFGAALLAAGGLWATFRFTHVGRSIRAVSQDPLAAELTGLSVRRVSARAFGLGTAIGALGGVLLSSLYVINPEFGGSLLLKSFCIIVLGGMDNMAGIFAGALLLGVTETAAGVYGAAWLQDVVSFVLLVAVLVVRPTSLAPPGRPGGS
jgi:branched-chain amino acid transport system permease protein